MFLRFSTAGSADEKGPLYSGDGGVMRCADGVVGNHTVKISRLQGETEGLRIGIRAWSPHLLELRKKSPGCAKAFSVPGTGLEPARPKAQPPEDCASTNFATRVGVKCPGRDSNPHALTDTWPSTMPVYQFQHLGGAKRRASVTPSFCDPSGTRTQDPLIKSEML